MSFNPVQALFGTSDPMSLILKVLDPEELISGPQARTLEKVCNILRRPIIGDITWNALCDSQYGESVSAFLLPYLGDKTVCNVSEFPSRRHRCPPPKMLVFPYSKRPVSAVQLNLDS